MDQDSISCTSVMEDLDEASESIKTRIRGALDDASTEVEWLAKTITELEDLISECKDWEKKVATSLRAMV